MSSDWANVESTAERAAEYELVYAARSRTLVPADQPRILITQLPRSGGTLLLRLFDGHPECHTTSREFGRSLGTARDRSLLAGPDTAWDSLHDPSLHRIFEAGGASQARSGLNRDGSLYPLVIPPGLHRRLFDDCYSRLLEPSERGVMDSYMTAYFNAWLDNQNLFSGPKKWITLFSPRLLTSDEKFDRFDAVHPDSAVLSIVRDPCSWYVSARAWKEVEWTALEPAIESWLEGMHALIELKRRLGDRLYVISFDELVSSTEKTMKRLAAYLGIRFRPILLEPTFNRIAVLPNSSFRARETGISKRPLRRYAKVLTEMQIARIRDQTDEVLAEAIALRSPAIRHPLALDTAKPEVRRRPAPQSPL